MNEKLRKPPIGLKPKFICDLERIEQIKAAMNRYLQVGMIIPIEWVEEYNALVKAVRESGRSV